MRYKIIPSGPAAGPVALEFTGRGSAKIIGEWAARYASQYQLPMEVAVVADGGSRSVYEVAYRDSAQVVRLLRKERNVSRGSEKG